MLAYSINIDQNKKVVVLEVNSVPVTHSSSYLLDNLISLHYIVVAYCCTNSKLLRMSSISEAAAPRWRDG